jgi:hypothetical protein
VQGARRAHIHWPIFNRRARPQDGMHRFPNADVFLGQDTIPGPRYVSMERTGSRSLFHHWGHRVHGERRPQWDQRCLFTSNEPPAMEGGRRRLRHSSWPCPRGAPAPVPLCVGAAEPDRPVAVAGNHRLVGQLTTHSPAASARASLERPSELCSVCSLQWNAAARRSAAFRRCRRTSPGEDVA